MTYDPLDRLLTAHATVFGGDGVHRFTYDALDNLRSWTLAGVKDYAQYTYDVNNRLASIQATGGAALHTMTHDVQGNLRTKDGTTYHFDVGNRLRAVVAPSVIETYRYDAHGRRVLAWTSLGNKLSMYASSSQLAYQQLWPTAMNKAVDYYYLSGSLVATRSVPLGTNNGTVTYQHTDALGSPVAVTDALGAVVERTDFDPYGNPINKVVDGVGYTGHVMDARTELVCMQQRYYDAKIGQFISVDPVGPLSNPIQHFARHHYTNNNPYRYKDPDGRYTCEGGRAACASVARQLRSIEKAARAHPPGSEGRQSLQGIVIFYGKPGEANGVVVKANENLEGEADGRTRIDGEVVTVRIDTQGINERSGGAAPEVLANTLVHEGIHGISQKAAKAMTDSRSKLMIDEISAYRAQGFYARSSGRDVFGMLKQDGSIDENQVHDLAKQSVELACRTGACRE